MFKLFVSIIKFLGSCIEYGKSKFRWYLKLAPAVCVSLNYAKYSTPYIRQLYDKKYDWDSDSSPNSLASL